MDHESEFPSNSRKKNVEPEPKKIEKVISGEVVRRKKPWGKRISEMFIPGDAKGAWSFVMLDVIVPATKNAIADAVSQGIERMIFGDVRSTSRRTGNRPGRENSFVSYNRYSPNTPRESYRDEPRNTVSRRARSSHDFDEIILPTRAEAEEVIDRLFDIVSRYEQATVSDLYELVGVAGNFTDEKYGWNSDGGLRGAGVTRIRNGYLLDLPKPELLD